MKLFIKLPTRSRPRKVLDLTKLYIERASGEPFVFALAIHDAAADPTMHTPEVQAEITQLCEAAAKRSIDMFVIEHAGSSKVAAYNADPGHRCDDWSIQVATSDDMFPFVDGYDVKIREEMQRRCPDLDGVLHFNDNFRPELMTLPIVGRAWYDYYGWVYNPVYKSLFCDNEMQDVARMLGKYHYCNDVVIEHRHPLWVKEPYDDLMKHTESFYERDGVIYRRRQAKHFNLLRTPKKQADGTPLYVRQRERREAGPRQSS